MASDRISSVIDSLISHLVPNNPDDDEDAAQERHDACFDIVKSIIDSPPSPGVSSDVNHASDLIKRKLIQTDPNDALRFSNLYSRLLALPVLKHKWAILYLLYQLSDSPDPDEPIPLSPVRPSAPNYREAISREALKRQSRDRSKTATPVPRLEEEQFKDAFQPDGLRKLPVKEPGQPENDKHNLPKRDVSLKSTLLASNHTESDPPEAVILRDLPFTLQGVSSTTLPFSNQATLKLPPTLPLPLISLLHTLAEPSLLYRGLDAFCKTPAQGLLGQSLRSAISGELRSYLSLIATLEAQIRRALSTIDESSPPGAIGKAGVTLKRCVVWTREATMGLRLMSLIAEESESQKGGQLITLIHSFSSSHGDPVVAAFAERLLGSFTRPFYDILRHWIYDGELLDPYREFFVREQLPNNDVNKKKVAGNVWEDKYEIDHDMIPSIITQDFAQKVFLIGKSLNFIRHSCGDSVWVEDYSKAASKELRYGDTATLEAWIDEAYKTTMKRLMDLMANRFNLFDHLQALKNYLLLGQGDFIALLMESLAANLDRPAGAQYRHALTAQLEHAIRGSNAQYDSPEVLRRLDARMLQLSHGDIGWDCFTLEYKIDAPVDVVVTEWGNRQYLKVFNFLWRIKRVEFALLTSWRKCMTGSRGVLQSSDPAVTQTWKSTRGTLAEMIHFVGQLQYYILFEVIESSWGELQKRIQKEDCTLDDLIKAHERYLTDITHKGLLGAKRKLHGSDEDDRASYLAQLSDILRFMLNYRDSVDGLYGWSVSDFTRRQEADVRGHALLDEGGAGGGGVPSEFPVLQERLRHLGQSFRTRLQILLGDLAYQPDVDMRFLGVAMNFNDVYQPTKRRNKGPAATGGATSANTSKG
ncbi:microtubule-nucleating Tub4p (gamma-tubulin) complex component [Purpureocillium lilacinum]|nr:spindle pole body component [Purpureocillium lilacinum]GJN76230.1 microtubule-nucleating Tub4p (gamma-tubulin) complex component [Purpureocillium lilacinum]GJN86579.1 microtubule-nucleating Tub4p (gamma-tubulin) complex component [Purpureocillium lilacinum]